MEKKRVSSTESAILKLLWKADDALSVAQVTQLMETENNIKWSYNTAGTILRRMDKKGFVSSTKRGPAFFYSAVLKEGETLNGAAAFVERYFQGSLHNFLAAFSEERDFTDEEFEDLKDWVNRLDGKR